MSVRKKSTMRSIHHSTLGLLAVSMTTLLPSALHAQALGGLGRPVGPSAPAQNAPAQSAPQQSVPQNQQPFTPFYPQNTAPQQMQPRNGPVFNRQAWPNQPPVITQYPSRGPVFSAPSYPNQNQGPVFSQRSYPGQSRRPAVPSGQAYSPREDQYYSNAPVFNRQNTISGSVRVTTPIGPQTLPRNGYYPIYGGAPVYNNGGGYYGGGYGAGVTVVGSPSFLGGYYYGNYCDVSFGVNTYPSIYSAYSGFPTYIYSPASVVVLSEPYSPVYVTGYQPFYTPSYPVVYNENIYYVGSQERAQEIVGSDDTARRAALRTAYPDGSYQAAFGDIERAWLDGNVNGLQKHLRGGDVKLSVFFKGRYSYSIATSDYMQITRDAFDKISTVSFKFDRLRKAKNGDVTAYGTHVYRGTSRSEEANSDGTVPFSSDRSDVTADNTTSAAPGVEKTISIAYTLRHQSGQWNIVAIDSTPGAGAK